MVSDNLPFYIILKEHRQLKLNQMSAYGLLIGIYLDKQ